MKFTNNEKCKILKVLEYADRFLMDHAHIEVPCQGIYTDQDLSERRHGVPYDGGEDGELSRRGNW